MPSLGNLLAQCRLRMNLNQDAAAGILGISKRQLQRYESDANVPEDVIMLAAIKFQAPELIVEYVSHQPIGEKLGGLSLNNINENHVAVLVKYSEELDEAIHTVKKLIEITINGLPDESKSELPLLYEQAIADVKTAIAQADKVVMQLAGIDVGLEAHRRHREKCIRRGYLKKEKQPALVAEKPAAYSVAY